MYKLNDLLLADQDASAPFFSTPNAETKKTRPAKTLTLAVQSMGVANNFGCFFLSGLPGGLDFVMLVMVRIQQYSLPVLFSALQLANAQ